MKTFCLIAAAVLLSAGTARADYRSNLTVEFVPPLADLEGGRWWLKEDAGQPSRHMRSGQVLRGIPDGDHVLQFCDGKQSNPLSTCIKPADMAVFVRPGVFHQVVADFQCKSVELNATTAAPAAQDAPAAELMIMLQPGLAVQAGAAWRIDGGDWQASGTRVGRISQGDHTVEYKPVSGSCSHAPAGEVVSLYLGGTTSLERRYAGPGC